MIHYFQAQFTQSLLTFRHQCNSWSFSSFYFDFKMSLIQGVNNWQVQIFKLILFLLFRCIFNPYQRILFVSVFRFLCYIDSGFCNKFGFFGWATRHWSNSRDFFFFFFCLNFLKIFLLLLLLKFWNLFDVYMFSWIYKFIIFVYLWFWRYAKELQSASFTLRLIYHIHHVANFRIYAHCNHKSNNLGERVPEKLQTVCLCLWLNIIINYYYEHYYDYYLRLLLLLLYYCYYYYHYYYYFDYSHYHYYYSFRRC